MSETSKTKTTRAQSAKAVNPKDEVLNASVTVPDVDDVDDVKDDGQSARFNWNDLMKDANTGNTHKNILKRCLADWRFKQYTNLKVKNVVATVRISKTSNRPTTSVTFVTNEDIPGMVLDKDHVDAFGEDTWVMGHSVFVRESAIGISGAMKESTKGAMFSDSVSKMTAVVTDPDKPVQIPDGKNIANALYAGGTIDVLCQFVPANTEYKNPFSTKVRKPDEEPKFFEEDRIIHHVYNLRFGETGEELYLMKLREMATNF